MIPFNRMMLRPDTVRREWSYIGTRFERKSYTSRQRHILLSSKHVLPLHDKNANVLNQLENAVFGTRRTTCRGGGLELARKAKVNLKYHMKRRVIITTDG